MRVILEGSLGPDGRHKFHQFRILPQVAFVAHSSVTLHFLPLKILICFPVLLNLVISALSGTLGQVMQKIGADYSLLSTNSSCVFQHKK